MELTDKEREKRDRIAQWAFDTRPVLDRLHLVLEDLDISWNRGEPSKEFTREISFLDGRMERLMCMTAAVTALGTQLYGRYAEGHGLDKAALNQVKKDADAISAYAMSEALWFAARQLPENHAIMVNLGEGLMPKAGETPEMGSNPQLGFGRVYARPWVARWLDQRVARLINEPHYRFEHFYQEVKEAGITVWGAAIDTLENTSRFAKGDETGPCTVLHLFNQPLNISTPYEGYMGMLVLPREIVHKAAESSVLLDFRTPRKLVMEAIQASYPGIAPANVHVWTLGGPSRAKRISGLWKEWKDVGAHIVDDDFVMPTGIHAFVESGTYTPTFHVGTWEQEGQTHLFLVDGYAASAEAVQGATLAEMHDLDATMVCFTDRFMLPYDREQHVMGLDPDAEDFKTKLSPLLDEEPDALEVDRYREMIQAAQVAGLPLSKRVIRADDFFPEKNGESVALVGFMCPDPYTGIPGVERVSNGVYQSTVRMATPRGDKTITFTLRLMESPDVGRLVFNPLLIRFIYGEDFHGRPVKISDSGRIRNELQTLCSEALDYLADNRMRIVFDRIPSEVITPDKREVLLEVLKWYVELHPMWFHWLDIIGPGDKAPPLPHTGACD
jgi:hypothetical protein